MADVEIDTREFERTLLEYARFDRRELPAIINAKLGDWAWEAAKMVRFTIPAIIRAVPDSMRGTRKAWWKFVQSVYNSGHVLKGKRRATSAEENIPYIDRSTGETIWRRKYMTTRRTTGEGPHRKNDLKRVSASILKRRAATCKSFVAQFLMTALMLGKRVGTVGGKNPAKYEGILTRMARDGYAYPSAAFSIPWRARTLENKRHEGQRESRAVGKQTIALQAIYRARDAVVADMKQKTEERYARQAARGAA